MIIIFNVSIVADREAKNIIRHDDTFSSIFRRIFEISPEMQGLLE